MSEFLYLTPELFLLFSAILVIFSKHKEILSFLGLAFTAYLVFLYQPYSEVFAFNSLLFFGKTTKLMKLLTLILGSIVALMFYASRNSNSCPSSCTVDANTTYEPQKDQVTTMMLFSILGMLFVISANNFMSLYIALELQALPTYIMAAGMRKSIKSSEAGVKYFILGSLASCIMVYGISILYINFGELSFDRLGSAFQMQNNLGVNVAMIFIISALLFKVAAAPFHMWIADVYQGSPKKVTAFFAIIPKISVIALMIRIFDTDIVHTSSDFLHSSAIVDIAYTDHLLRKLLMFVGTLSVFIGAIAAIMQNNLRRLLAYSTINHMGYILLGIAVSYGNYNDHFYISSPILYIIFYSILNVGIFSFILLIKTDDIYKLAGFAKNKTILPICFSILLLSSAGIPPFAGFFAKFYLISEVVKSGFNSVAFLVLLSNGFAVYYYLKIIKIMYFDKSESEIKTESCNLLIILTIIVSTINTLFFLRFIPYFKVI